MARGRASGSACFGADGFHIGSGRRAPRLLLVPIQAGPFPFGPSEPVFDGAAIGNLPVKKNGPRTASRKHPANHALVKDGVMASVVQAATTPGAAQERDDCYCASQTGLPGPRSRRVNNRASRGSALDAPIAVGDSFSGAY